ARKLKAHGIVPAIIYGGKEKPQPLQLSVRDINAMLSHASGENILVELEIDGEKSNRTALVQEVQHSTVGGDVLHVDFHAIPMDEKIQADVPLEPLGVANGVKNFGGDRKSTRLNSSHLVISYAVFCLKKKSVIAIRKCSLLSASPSRHSTSIT